MTRPRIAAPLLIAVVAVAQLNAAIEVHTSDDSPLTSFAADQIRAAIAKRTSPSQYRITFQITDKTDSDVIRAEGFRITKTSKSDHTRITIAAHDEAGLMYGGLEVAEVIRTLGIEQLKDVVQNPSLAMRGTKFNIPLDVRTPSYTDVCDAALRKYIPEMWSFEFWREYIDTLAQYRYNFVSLWNLHPFPSLVRVPDYPNVALNDVWRSRVDWQENYPLEGHEFVTKEILEDVEVVKQMSIEQKIEFWRNVMAYGKLRNVDFYVVTWNIFTYGTDGEYGITDSFRNERTIDYFRKSVRQLLLTYPDLAGVGLTTGENMRGASFQDKEDWAMATYGQGVLDVAKLQPKRKLTFIHRQHMAKATEIARTFKPLVDAPNVDFIFSFKYAKAHVYSATTQPYHHSFVNDLGALQTIWTLRNDDVYYFRWGAPHFVREFVQNIPKKVTRGYYYGSDQYVWGREFLQRGEQQQRQLEVIKHWYQWMLWGRLAFNPELDDARLKAILAERFALSESHADQLFDAWQHASMVYPTTTGFHWGALDFQWYIEGCQSRPGPAQNETGFHDVNRFISLAPHARSNCQPIPDFAKTPDKVDDAGRKSPPQVADTLEYHAQRALTLVQAIPTTDNAELRRTIRDIHTVANLGLYYADKIRGATSLAVFRESKQEAAKEAAINHLVKAAQHWSQYTQSALVGHKNPLWTNRVGHVDWKQTYQHVLQDIRIAGGEPADFGLPAGLEFENEEVEY